jgi:DNA adenine methylase
MTQPFVKWAGGKRQLLPAILSRLPMDIRTFYEPFVGGGAVFFALAREGTFNQAVINDLNEDLMQAYRMLASSDGVGAVCTLLKTYPFEPAFFTEIRSRNPNTLNEAEKTARFIYLNKAGFNGLYRVNKKGEFNVPIGKYTNPNICDEDNLIAVSQCLHQKIEFQSQDFETSVEPAVAGDVVYFDPPYLPRSETSNFTAYTEEGFGLSAHKRLADTFKRLAERGVVVLLSNADVPKTHELYEGFTIDIVEARRNINSKGDKRGNVTECLIGANLPASQVEE